MKLLLACVSHPDRRPRCLHRGVRASAVDGPREFDGSVQGRLLQVQWDEERGVHRPSRREELVRCGGARHRRSATASVPDAPASASAIAPPKTTPAATKTVAPSTAPAAGEGPGQVWVNTRSKVYHCEGTKYDGKTLQGQYMTQAAAKAAGHHADHGKACP